MESVRLLNEMGRRARAGQPEVENYLHSVASDPITGWFTELLREKSAELEHERHRVDQLTSAVRAWHQTRIEGSQCPSGADVQLVNVLQALGIIAA